MSVNEGVASSSKKTQKNVEILEPGVSLVKPQRRYRRSVAILTRLFFAILFLGLGVLAVYYSISISEKHQQEETNRNIPKTEFSLFHSQISTRGVLTIEQNVTGGMRHFIKYDLQWFQDDVHSRLLFNVTDPESNTSNVYYVFQNNTVHVGSDKDCEFLDVGYVDFIYLFGVVRLEKTGNDLIKMNNTYQSIEVFEGVPDLGQDLPIVMPGYDNGPPRLAFAYSYPDQGATAGWQIYFDSHEKQDKKHIEWVEYWFTDMQEGEPNAELFVDYTTECVKHKTDMPTSTTVAT